MKNRFKRLYSSFIATLANQIAYEIKELEKFERWQIEHKDMVNKKRAVAHLDNPEHIPTPFELYKQYKGH